MSRIYNFNAGPANLPLEVLEEVQREFLDFQGTGMSIIESSHRAKAYDAIHQEAIANIRAIMDIPEDYSILFLQGGASLQFTMLPMNLLPQGGVADYLDSGAWSHKAVKEAQKIGKVNVLADTSKDIPTRMPDLSKVEYTKGASYVYLTTNETIAGTRYNEFPKTDAPIVADVSSEFMSRHINVKDFGVIYGGAQKNLAPAGVTIVIIRNDLAQKAPANLPAMLDYRTHIDNNSLYNTPPCFGIYVLALVTRWIRKFGVEKLYKQNVDKAAKLYAAIDGSGGFYHGTALKEYRSDMNVTFRIFPDGKAGDEELEKKFVSEATKAGFAGLKGHRSVGGLRASIYNAFPPQGVEDLVAFMADFQKANG